MSLSAVDAAVKMARKLRYRTPCHRCAGLGYIEWRGAELRACREWRGLSLREVARRMKLSPAYLSDVELNRRQASQRVRDFYDDF